MAEVGRPIDIDYPTLEDIVRLNRRHIQETGGRFSGQDNLRIPGSLEWVLDAIQYPLFGEDLYPTLVEKAVILAWVITGGHVFHDGCKRTGMSALEAMIESGGFQLSATDDEIVAIAIQVAKDETGPILTRDDFLQWVRDRLVLAV